MRGANVIDQRLAARLADELRITFHRWCFASARKTADTPGEAVPDTIQLWPHF
jgi:hypothetical protein